MTFSRNPDYVFSEYKRVDDILGNDRGKFGYIISHIVEGSLEV